MSMGYVDDNYRNLLHGAPAAGNVVISMPPETAIWLSGYIAAVDPDAHSPLTNLAQMLVSAIPYSPEDADD
jgi:hypothetical protein